MATAGKKAALTRKRRQAGAKAALTRKRRAAGRKAAVTRKRRAKFAAFRSGEGKTTQIGFENPHHQRCHGTLSVAGTDHLQLAYRLECLLCGFVYGANGSDIHERKCPKCQSGAEGIKYWNDV